MPRAKSQTSALKLRNLQASAASKRRKRAGAKDRAWTPEREFPIKTIKSARVVQNGDRLEWSYLIEWKGYPGADNYEPNTSFLNDGPPVLTFFWRAMDDLAPIDQRIPGYEITPPLWYLKEGKEYYNHLKQVAADPNVPMAEEPPLPTSESHTDEESN